MTRNYIYALAIGVLTVMMASCDKVSPAGVLLGNTSVDDRVEMSVTYYRNISKGDKSTRGNLVLAGDDYTFLVGSDSHVQTDTGRMAEMCRIALEGGDAFMTHLGDIADTKAEYYMNLKTVLFKAIITKKEKDGFVFERDENGEIEISDEGYAFYTTPDDSLNFKILDIHNVDIKSELNFFPTVGNHDITHNGWALYSNIFGSSFYDVFVFVSNTSDAEPVFDHLIFLDTANGTLGQKQVEYIDRITDDPSFWGMTGLKIRHTFVFTHSNLFRPERVQFSSTFPREEKYYLYNKFIEWDVDLVFMGHVHSWDERDFGGVRYLTLNTMSEINKPEPGEYLVRVHCHRDGTISYEPVMMNYTPKKKNK